MLNSVYNISMKKKKIRVRLKDITILDSKTHYAEWTVLGVFQCYIGRKELERIVFHSERKEVYMKRLYYKLEDFSRKGLY